jgi:hypothetical protein
MTTLPYECQNCGAAARAACNCGVAYVPAGERAAAAVAANPEKSDRAIAEEIGTSHTTVQNARKATGNLLPVEKRTGRDGKKRKQPARKSKRASADLESIRERAGKFGYTVRKRRNREQYYLNAAGGGGIMALDLKSIRQVLDRSEGESETTTASTDAETSADASAALAELRNEVNCLHREALDFIRKFARVYNAHRSEIEQDAKAAEAEGRSPEQTMKGCLHNGLMHTANRLMDLAQIVDGRGRGDEADDLAA